jgi:hypothetical protein
MEITLKAFKDIAKQYNEAAKHLSAGHIRLDQRFGGYPGYKEEMTVSFKNLNFKSAAKMYHFCQLHPILTRGLSRVSALGESFWAEFEQTTRETYQTLDVVAASQAKDFKTLKLAPQDIPMDYRPLIIQHAPLEHTEGNYTYRFLTTTHKGVYHSDINLIGRNDDPLYDYLDKGFFVMELATQRRPRKFIIANQYDVNTAHIFAMCKIQPKLADMLQNGCFINVYDAELRRLRMQKKLNEASKKLYAPIAETIDSDYKKNTTLIVVGKLMSGEVEKTAVNNITFRTGSATYENISIEAGDLLASLYDKINFNGEFDIYGIVSVYASDIETRLNALASENKDKKEPEGGLNLDEHQALLEDEAAEAGEKKSLPVFSINGISITAAVSSTGQRYINDVRINKDEIAQAIHRASCHRGAEEYKLFLKSISRMSIRWHDIIANGMPVKIHENITRDEYSNPVPGPAAPAIKFVIDKADKCIKIVINPERSVRVALGRLTSRIDTINRRTDSKIYYPKNKDGWYHRTVSRNYVWAAEEIAEALIDCCTFTKKVKDETGAVKPVVEMLITKEDIVALLGVATEQKRKALERSKEFLQTAVRLTGAVEIEFMGKSAYKVKGALREYAVVISTAKVYDYDTKQYRCIVNDRHFAGVGYDDIASRLLALKNDSVMQEKINTLRGAAQPQHENVHDGDLPNRDNRDFIGDYVDHVLNNREQQA